ncbi:hypothetical protein AAG663_16995 [Bacillus licheniformis]
MLKKHPFEAGLRKLVTSLSLAGGSVQEQVFQLKSELESQKEKLRQKQEADVSLKHAAEQIKELAKEVEYFQSQIAELFQKAGADGREMFVGLAKRDQARKELTARARAAQKRARQTGREGRYARLRPLSGRTERKAGRDSGKKSAHRKAADRRKADGG